MQLHWTYWTLGMGGHYDGRLAANVKLLNLSR